MGNDLLTEKSFQELYEDAKKAHKASDFEESQKLFEEAYALEPNNPTLLYNYGNLMSDLERFEDAASLLEAQLQDGLDRDLRTQIYRELGVKHRRLSQVPHQWL